MDLPNTEGMSVDEAAAALMASASKDALAKYAREKCGAKFDDARTSKEAIARMILGHHSGQQPPPRDTPEKWTEEDDRKLLAAFDHGHSLKELAAMFDGRGEREIQQRLTYYSRTIARTEEQTPPEVEQQPKPAETTPRASHEQKNAGNIAAAIAAALASVKLGVDPDEIRAAVKEEMKATADALRKEIVAQIFRIEVKLPDGTVRDVGRQHRQFPQLLKALSAGCNVWVAGPAGSGKTTAAEAAANALNLPFSFDGAMDTEYKVVGFVDAQGRIVSTSFRKAYTEGGVHLFDECDASLAPATLAVNAALANGHAAFPDGIAKKHPNFRCIAAANTWGLGATFDYVGRNKLDAAFLDRFVRVNWEYDEMLERDISGNPDWCTYVQTMRTRAKGKGLKVVISPRATLFGAQLLSAGMKRDEVIDLTLRNGMRPEDWKSLQ